MRMININGGCTIYRFSGILKDSAIPSIIFIQTYFLIGPLLTAEFLSPPSSIIKSKIYVNPPTNI